MWRSIVLSLAGPVVKSLLLVAVGRAKAKVAESGHLNELEKALANETIDNLVLEIQKDLGGGPTPPAE